MRYAALGKTGLKTSILGFGCMRFPMKDDKVDREKTAPLVRRAIELGVNFFDTAIFYCNGDSQAALGEALERDRKNVIVSAKNHDHELPSDEWRKHLDDSLTFLRTDYLDLYSHHALNWETYRQHIAPENDGLLRTMLHAKEEGLVRHIGFSFHDTPDNLVRIAETGHFEYAITQYNLIDRRNHEAMLRLGELGLGVIVMGPVGGGRLGIPSAAIHEVTGGRTASTVEAALRFVWAHPAVSIAMSGMENIEMLEENVRIADEAGPFDEEELDAVNALVSERMRRHGVYCSGCGYCQPCPAKINIPGTFDLYAMDVIFGLSQEAGHRYGKLEKKPSECTACGTCVERCPQKIDIPKQLGRIAEHFERTKATD